MLSFLSNAVILVSCLAVDTRKEMYNLLNLRFSGVAVSVFPKSLLAALRRISVAFLLLAFVTLLANLIELDSRASNSSTPGEARKSKRTVSNQVRKGLQSSMGTKHNQTKLIAGILDQ